MDDKLTVVILSYKRLKNIEYIIESYNKYEIISEIIIWNNNKDVVLQSKGKTNIINCTYETGLDSRFLGMILSKNNGVLIQDDDFMLSEMNMLKLFNHWKSDQEIQHGIFGRVPLGNNTYASPKTGIDMSCEMVLTGLQMVHKKYAPLFFQYRLHPSILDLQDIANKMNVHRHNGEDIIFSYMIRNIAKRNSKIYNIPFQTLSSPHPVSGSPNHYNFRTIVMRTAQKLFPI